MTPQEEARTFEAHRGMAVRLASRWRGAGRDRVEFGDLVVAAEVGLLQAIRSWTPDGGASLEWYACHRILGAIRDLLREEDHATRTQRRKSEAPPLPVSLDALLEGADASDVLPDHRAEAVEAEALRRVARSELARVVAGLPQGDGHLVILYYLHGWTMRRISEHIGVSEVRVCQRLQRARAALRQILDPDEWLARLGGA
jgi:RNA polymerase sigma factor (sigma-70 family)